MARRKPEPEDRPPENGEVISKGPCPKCDTTKGNVTYADGHSHCFACGHTAFLTADGTEAGPDAGSGEGPAQGRPDGFRGAPSGGSELLRPADTPGAFDQLTKRGLTSGTLRKYGYFKAGFKGTTVQVAPYYDQNGELCQQKVRMPDKSFMVLKAHDAVPAINDCWLFGRHVYGDRYDRRVIITEGELDALSVAQVRDFKDAVVSVNGGAKAAAKSLKANYLWLDRFSEIVLWFDDDEPGRAASEECAALFKVGKVRLAKVAGHKDASDVLQANLPGDIEAAIYGATAWRPKGIVNAKDSDRDVRAPTEKVIAWSYPPQMEKLQEMTAGLHRGEVIYHVAGTGVGKSTALREIQYHLVEQGVKIAVLSFEDTVRDMKFGLMSIKESERLHLVAVPDPEDTKALKAYDDRMVRIHAEVFGGGLVELFDPETADWSMEAILGYVRYCAKALDCTVIFIDPLSFVAAGIELTADERRVLDRVAGEFAKLAKELGIHIQISHHLKRTAGIPHEEGAPTSLNELRSSGGLANFAMGVIGWERNNQAAEDGWRVTQSRIIKPVRRTGKSGLADVLYYTEQGRLIKSPIPFPPIGKPDGKDEGDHRRPAFGPVDATDY